MVAEAIRKSARVRRLRSLVADTLQGPCADVHSLVLLGVGKLLGLLLAPVLSLDGLLALEVPLADLKDEHAEEEDGADAVAGRDDSDSSDPLVLGHGAVRGLEVGLALFESLELRLALGLDGRREEELEVGGVRDEAKVWHGHAEVHADGTHEEDERAAIKVLGHLAPTVQLGNEADEA
ncbi:hypothetical protein L1887_57144 [Cichorium endivia]|nr:hypothetical protein L1887_57144 [Cichorium endivia]